MAFCGQKNKNVILAFVCLMCLLYLHWATRGRCHTVCCAAERVSSHGFKNKLSYYFSQKVWIYHFPYLVFHCHNQTTWYFCGNNWQFLVKTRFTSTELSLDTRTQRTIFCSGLNYLSLSARSHGRKCWWGSSLNGFLFTRCLWTLSDPESGRHPPLRSRSSTHTHTHSYLCPHKYKGL